jgi:hypothetical protein
MEKQKAVIFDIDGVLAKKNPDREHREYDKVDLDLPIECCFDLLLHYIAKQIPHCEILFITGRKKYCFDKTLEWLQKNIRTVFKDHFFVKHERFLPNELFLIENYRGDIVTAATIFMRDDKDHRPSDILKKEIYENHIKDKYDVIAVFEDDPKNVKMFRDLGLFVFDVGRENEK